MNLQMIVSVEMYNTLCNHNTLENSSIINNVNALIISLSHVKNRLKG